MKSIHFAGASLFALAIATPSFAQDTTQPAPQAAEAEDTSADIIVTASKRAQTLQDTPISVAVASVQQIEQSQIRDLIDLQTLVPSLKVGQLQSSSNTNFIIRGFGNGANNVGIEPSVGVFIDGVYRSRSAAQIGDLPNIERVEVLRGPQSTLFGKNASAGIISIVTAEPQFKLGGQIEASYGNYNAIVVKGSITGPLSDTIAVSLAGNYNKRDGYARYANLNVDTNNRNRYGVRGQILFQPSSDFKLRIIADYDNIDERCCTVANLFDGPTGNAVRGLGGQITSNQPFSYTGYANFPSSNKIDNYGISAQMDWQLADTLALTSISAYRGVKTNTNADSDFTSADLIGQNANQGKIDTFTQELRLQTSFDGPINFLAGVFYFNEKIHNENQLTFGKDFRNYANLLSGGGYGASEAALRSVNPNLPTGAANAFGAQGQGRFEKYDYRNEAVSLFGQVDLEIARGLTATAGFNYTMDRKSVIQNNRATDVFSSIDLDASVAALRNGGIAQTVAGFIGLPSGSFASAAQIAGFAAAQPAAFAQIQAGVNAQVNPLLGLKPLQFIPPYLNFPNAVENGKTSDNNFSYTLRLAYKFNSNISTYATYATGFKASSWNLSTDSRPFARDFIPGSPVNNPAPSAIRTANLQVNNLTTGTRYAGPEDAQVYEVGLKGQWRGFGFNLAVFKQILKGFQSNIFQGTGFVLGNAEKQSTKGFELDFSLTPVRNLNFTTSITYLDPKYDLFTGGSAFNPATNGVQPTNLTGVRPSGISEWAVAVGTTYTAELSDAMKAIFHVDFNFDSAFIIAQGLPYKASPETLNASVTFALRNGLELGIWGRNLTEPKFNPVIFPGVAQSGTLSAYPSPPKTYGVNVRFKF